MKMMTAATFAVCTCLTTPLAAGDTPVVVELFSSQGCASCPPADAILRSLAKRDDVIALSLHVDYWDYLGWKDEFARASHTVRQRGYAHAAGRNMIYTPQMIINGREDVVGAHAMEVMEIIDRYDSSKAVAAVEATRDGPHVLIHADPVSQPIEGPLTVQLVQYAPLKTVDITRGENAGHELNYVNVVNSWQTVGEWDGSGPFDAEAEIDGDRPAVVLIQYPGPGEIVAAALAK